MAAAQAALFNQLLQKLASTAPDINSALVLGTGASELKNVFTAEQMTAILPAYMAGLKVAFAISVTAAGLAFCFSPFNNWKKIDAHREAPDDTPIGAAV